MKRRKFFKMLGSVIGGLIVAKHLPAEETPKSFIGIDKTAGEDIGKCYYYAINQNGEKGWWTVKELTDNPEVMQKVLGREGWNTLRGNDLFYTIKEL